MCDIQVIVVRTADNLDDLRAGGVAMVLLYAEKDAGAMLDPALSAGSLMGKRYVDDGGAVGHQAGCGDPLDRHHCAVLEGGQSRCLPATEPVYAGMNAKVTSDWPSDVSSVVVVDTKRCPIRRSDASAPTMSDSTNTFSGSST